jgi:hypothetical protein
MSMISGFPIIKEGTFLNPYMNIFYLISPRPLSPVLQPVLSCVLRACPVLARC